jgi:DNA-binding transcriptional MerR regulator
MWLSSSEVTRKLNISLRQLYYWELKGIVTPRMITMGSREFKRYSTRDYETLRSIKDFLDQGYTLTGAVQRVHAKVH